METDRKWIIVRIDGKIAAISTDYRQLASISVHLARHNCHGGTSSPYSEITATSTDFEQVWKLRESLEWEDLILFGTDFQKSVWKRLFSLNRGSMQRQQENPDSIGLFSYSDFAELCNNRAGVRAVAHAVGLNPVAVIIPCHLIVPKEAIDRIHEIRQKAESTIFKGADLCLGSILNEPGLDFGEYALGKDLKRALILKEIL